MSMNLNRRSSIKEIHTKPTITKQNHFCLARVYQKILEWEIPAKTILMDGLSEDDKVIKNKAKPTVAAVDLADDEAYPQLAKGDNKSS